MKIVIPAIDLLPELDRNALRAMKTQIARTWQVANTDDGLRRHTILSVYHNQTQSHTTSGSFEAVTFNTHDDLRDIPTVTEPGGVHSTTTGRSATFIVPGNPGEDPARWLRLRVRVVFAQDADGDRGLRIMLNDAIVRRPALVRAASGAPTRLTAVAGFPVSPGDAVHVEAYQDSGGALDLGSADRTEANELEWELI